jgi:hypothetical protein
MPHVWAEKPSQQRPDRTLDVYGNAGNAADQDAAQLLYRHGIGSVLVSLFASSGLAFISIGQVPSHRLGAWWLTMMLVLLARGVDILHFHKIRTVQLPKCPPRREIQRFGCGLIAAAVVWSAFPLMFLSSLSQSGRAYTAMVLCGMVGGGATVLAPSKILSLLFCSFLVLPVSLFFLSFPGSENMFFGLLGFLFFVVMCVS